MPETTTMTTQKSREQKKHRQNTDNGTTYKNEVKSAVPKLTEKACLQ